MTRTDASNPNPNPRSRHNVLVSPIRWFALTQRSDNPWPGPLRATAGPGKTLSWGPITTSFRMRRVGGNVGRDVPSPSHYGSGECRKLRQWGPSGAKPRSKMDLCIFEVRKKATWNSIFSIFERWRAPKRRRARKNFPSSPSRRACPWPTDGPFPSLLHNGYMSS